MGRRYRLHRPAQRDGCHGEWVRPEADPSEVAVARRATVRRKGLRRLPCTAMTNDSLAISQQSETLQLLGPEPLLFGIENIEEKADMPNDVMRDILGNVVLHEFLHLIGRFAQAFVPQIVVPLDDFDARTLGRMFLDPLGDGSVVCAGGDEFLEIRALDPGETEEDVIEGTVEVVFADGAGQFGTAFIQRAFGEDVPGDHCVRAAGKILG